MKVSAEAECAKLRVGRCSLNTGAALPRCRGIKAPLKSKVVYFSFSRTDDQEIIFWCLGFVIVPGASLDLKLNLNVWIESDSCGVGLQICSAISIVLEKKEKKKPFLTVCSEWSWTFGKKSIIVFIFSFSDLCFSQISDFHGRGHFFKHLTPQAQVLTLKSRRVPRSTVTFKRPEICPSWECNSFIVSDGCHF